MPELRMTVRSQVPGGFNPDSFDHLLQEQVEAAGLDPRHRHQLIAATVAADGSSAELLLHSEPTEPVNQLRPAFRFVAGTPTAKVRVVLAEDHSQVLAEVQLDAPLHVGQRIALGEDEYLVTAEDWPGRDPLTGICSGDIDWQHAYVSAADPVESLPQVLERATAARASFADLPASGSAAG